MRHLKKQNIICFSPFELKELYRSDGKEKLYRTLRKKGLSWSELIGNYAKKIEVVNATIEKDLKCKEQIEILAALNSCIVFYGEDCEIGFPLKDSYSVKRNPIRSLESLKKATKEYEFTDFVFIVNGRLYQFQFKLYKGILETKEFIDFLEKMLNKYGGKLEKVNFLIMLQGTESNEMQKLNIIFKQVREKLNSKSANSGNSILIRFNEGNRFDHLIEVYPGSFAIKSPIDPNYLAGKLLYS